MTFARAVGLLLMLAAGGLSAQTKFSSRVESVRVDVLVTANGQPVPGLSAADFEVRDNGAPQQVQLIGAGTLPLDVLLALDMSSSLEPDRLATLRRAGTLLLNGLKPEDRAGLLTFSHAVSLRQAMTLEHQSVREALEAAEPGGGTSLADALYAGITLSEASGRRPLLIVFSDGIDTTSWLGPEDATTAAKRFETVVYAVSAGRRGDTPQILHEITAQSGGNLLQVTSRDLEASFVRILEEFRQRYLLSYTLSSAPKPGWHRIEVRVRKRGMNVKARSGYLVGPSGGS
jgi:Ca-activated chloride channel homolog